jgi:N-acetylglucosamine kinase-like BadF-type ATPase
VTDPTSTDTTKPRQIRIAGGHWEAYRRVCDQLGTTRAEDIVAHIRRAIAEHGDPEALRLLQEADAEVAERRARMHTGRPPKTAG